MKPHWWWTASFMSLWSSTFIYTYHIEMAFLLAGRIHVHLIEYLWGLCFRCRLWWQHPKDSIQDLMSQIGEDQKNTNLIYDCTQIPLLWSGCFSWDTWDPCWSWILITTFLQACSEKCQLISHIDVDSMILARNGAIIRLFFIQWAPLPIVWWKYHRNQIRHLLKWWTWSSSIKDYQKHVWREFDLVSEPGGW